MYVYSLHIQKITHTIFSTILHIRLFFRSLQGAGTVEKYTFLCMFFLYNDYTSFNCDYAEKWMGIHFEGFWGWGSFFLSIMVGKYQKIGSKTPATAENPTAPVVFFLCFSHPPSGGGALGVLGGRGSRWGLGSIVLTIFPAIFQNWKIFTKMEGTTIFSRF